MEFCQNPFNLELKQWKTKMKTKLWRKLPGERSFIYRHKVFRKGMKGSAEILGTLREYFRKAAIAQRYRRSPSPKGEVMSSRPRDMHQPPKFTALIPREPEAKWVGARPGYEYHTKENNKTDEKHKKGDGEKEGRGRKKTFANGIKSLCIYVPRIANYQYNAQFAV